MYDACVDLYDFILVNARPACVQCDTSMDTTTTNNNNNRISIAPHGQNFRGAGGRSVQ